MSAKKRWPLSHVNTVGGYLLDLRSGLAWEIIRTYGLVAGHSNRQDSTGRAVLDLLPVKDVVERAFALADLFVDTAEARGEIKDLTEADAEASHRRAGELSRIAHDAEFPRSGRLHEEAAGK